MWYAEYWELNHKTQRFSIQPTSKFYNLADTQWNK